jgi:hypothetical protein
MSLQGSKVVRLSCVEAWITEEPCALIGHARVCGGDGPRGLSLPGYGKFARCRSQIPIERGVRR